MLPLKDWSTRFHVPPCNTITLCTTPGNPLASPAAWSCPLNTCKSLISAQLPSITLA